jgi:hypothetical protein
MPPHKPMVPFGQPVPTRAETALFVVRPLLVTDAEADHEAWSSGVEELQGTFGPGSVWPADDMTLEDNVLDLAWHQREHESRGSFAFTVVDPDDVRCLGCIYLSPARKVGYQVEVHHWARPRGGPPELEQALGDFVREWVQDAWPLDGVLHPGLDVDWDTYLALPDQPHW